MAENHQTSGEQQDLSEILRIRREKLGKAKLFGSILSLVAVTVMTVLIYINRGTI